MLNSCLESVFTFVYILKTIFHLFLCSKLKEQLALLIIEKIYFNKCYESVLEDIISIYLFFLNILQNGGFIYLDKCKHLEQSCHSH